MEYRTDLALESKLLYEAASSDEIEGINTKEEQFDEDISITRIEIVNEVGSKILSKPMGKYITLEINGLIDGKEGLKERASEALGNELKNLVGFKYDLKVMVVGLGNDKVTPDALGPYTASKIKVTRHLFIIYEADGDEEMSCVSAIVPGVMGSTGIETAEIIKKSAELVKPHVIIAIDSLAARDINRVNTTIQINDIGISPGAGIGNFRAELSKNTLGCEVIAIGVPTVIDANTLVIDALKGMNLKQEEIFSYIDKNKHELVVTSTDIDTVIKDFSDIIANAINITLHPGIYK